MLSVECHPLNFIYKPIYWSFRMSGGLWYWARRRLTLAGWAVGTALMLTAAVGSDIDNTVTYQTFALLFVLMLFAFLCSFWFRGKFSAIRRLPRLGTVGQPLPYHIEVKNLTREAQTGLTLLENLEDPRPTYRDWLGFQMAEGRRVRPFRISERRYRNPFRLATVKEAEVPPMLPQSMAEA